MVLTSRMQIMDYLDGFLVSDWPENTGRLGLKLFVYYYFLFYFIFIVFGGLFFEFIIFLFFIYL